MMSFMCYQKQYTLTYVCLLLPTDSFLDMYVLITSHLWMTVVQLPVVNVIQMTRIKVYMHVFLKTTLDYKIIINSSNDFIKSTKTQKNIFYYRIDKK